MSSNETNEAPADVRDDATDTSPMPDAGGVPQLPWSRRTFLRAAALGAAVAGALMVDQDQRGRLHLGGAAALADDLSDLQCTANDVRVIGPGIVLNEKCDCTGTFDALVSFMVENNAAAQRYCLTIHFCPLKLSNGQTLDLGDVVLADVIPGKSTLPYAVVIKNFPCGAGLLCFGAKGPEEFGVFPKGARCPDGQCCTTITYNVNKHDPCPDTTKQIPSKCRHQQVCIQGRSVSLTCVDDPKDDTDSCTPICGGTSTLVLCASGELPFQFSLTADVASATISAPTISADGTCATYKVATKETTVFTGAVTDKGGCKKETKLTLTVTPVTVTSFTATPPKCAGGKTHLKACGSGGGSIKYEFFEGETSLGSVTSSTGCGELDVLLPSGAHTLKVVATNAGGCTAESTANVTVPTAVKADLSLSGDTNCDGKLTFTATVTGGTPPYKIAFSVDGTEKQSGTGTTFSYGPVLDGTCHKVSVKATDANDCPSTPTKDGGDVISVKQCVKTDKC